MIIMVIQGLLCLVFVNRVSLMESILVMVVFSVFDHVRVILIVGIEERFLATHALDILVNFPIKTLFRHNPRYQWVHVFASSRMLMHHTPVRLQELSARVETLVPFCMVYSFVT